MIRLTIQEAIELIKQVPLYRYECELEKNRQSDLFQALNLSIEAMQELQHYKDLEEQGRLVVLQASILTEIYNLIHDINPNEIAEQISVDQLFLWTSHWRDAMKAKLAELKGTEE